MYIIGLCGKSGHGKDYAANIMYDLWGYHILPLALPVKLDAIAKHKQTYKKVFETKPPTTRKLLQQLGTEKGRDVFGEDVWLRYTFAMAKWASQNWGVNKFVISDVRFKNEFDALKAWGAPVYRIIGDAVIKEKFGLKGDAANHLSETDLDDVALQEYDALIYNTYGDRKGLILQLENHLTLTERKEM